MEKSYEKNGLIYFEKPFEVDYVDWIPKHLDCDSIITKESLDPDRITVICYASREEFNILLKKIRDEVYPDCDLLRGMGSEEVNCI